MPGPPPRPGTSGSLPPSHQPYSYQMKLFDLKGLTNQFSSIFSDYKGWISRNPGKASDVESFFKILAYLLPGRVRGNSTVIPELLYSTANVVSFWHDQILQKELEAAAELRRQQQQNDGVPGTPRRGQNGTVPSTSSTNQINDESQSASRKKQIFRIQTCLCILEYFEVFLEVAARRLWGEGGKWLVVFIMQAVKACLRSVLVFYYKVGISRSPAIPTFDRTKYQPNRVSPNQNIVFVLKHSGRVIRKLHASPPMYSRDWTVPEVPLSLEAERNLPTNALIAEMIHIARPLCHLISMGACGNSSWKPWLLSLAMDVSSLYLHSDPARQLRKSDKVELQRRTLSLFLYLLRSPFYDQATKARLVSSLEGIGSRVPLIGNLLLLLAQAIPQWQGTYSYVWS